MLGQILNTFFGTTAVINNKEYKTSDECPCEVNKVYCLAVIFAVVAAIMISLQKLKFFSHTHTHAIDSWSLTGR